MKELPSMIKFFNTALYPRYLFPLALFTLVFSGCSTLPSEETQWLIKQTPQQRITKLAQLQQWQITGKIAFLAQSSRKSATLSWQVDEKKGTQQLNLTSYFGINVLQLESYNNQHKIRVDGKTYHGNNLAALILNITGLSLPTKALSYWLKGIPYQENDSISYHKITQLPQTLSSHYNNELWLVSYSNYQYINGYNLATKFSIKKENLLIKISVNHWSVTGQ